MFFQHLLLLIIFDFFQQSIVAISITTSTWNCSIIDREPFSLFYRNRKTSGNDNEYLQDQCQITIDYDSDEWNRCHISWTNINRKSINLNQIIANLIQTTNIKLKRIITIKLVSCSIDNVDDLLKTNKRNYIRNLISTIEYLDLTYNNIRKLPSLASFPRLKYLCLDYNEIEQDNLNESRNINNDLIGLSLRGNKNLILNNSLFFSSYLKLTMLDLSNCNLKILPKTLFQNLTTLNYLSLTNNFLNQLPYLPDKLDYLDLSYNQFIYLNEKILKLNNLHTLHLKYNQIRSLEFLKYYYQYDDDEHINNTIDQDNYIYSQYLRLSLRGNPLLCDCWMTKFYDNYYGGGGSEIDNNHQIIINDLEILKCQLILPYNNNNTPSTFIYKSFSELEKSDLLCSYEQYCFTDCSCCDFVACDCNNICPNDCSCYHNINWTRNIVNCSLANLTDIPQLLPEKVTELSYESNNIQNIKSYIFVGKTSLVSLNLAHNNLTYLDNDTFCTVPNLEYLDLTYNPIILDNFDIFMCLERLHVIILSNEQLKNKTNILLPYSWNIYSKNQNLNLFRISSNITTLSKRLISLYNFTNQQQTNNNVKREHTANKGILTTSTMMSYLLSSSISPNLTSMSDFQSISQQFLFKNYHSPLPQLFDSTKCSDILSTMSSTNLISFAHQNQTIFLILLLLLILIMSCLIILLLLSYCRRKKLNMKRRHLNIELRSDHPIHHLSQTADIRMYNKYYKKINQNQHQDSLYEQLPSSSSDNSEQQFLSSKNTYEKYETPPSCCNYHRQICKPTLPLSCSHHEYQYASYEQDAISSTQPNSTHHHYPHQQQQQCAILLWANRLFYTADHRTHRNCIDYHQSCPSELHHLQACLLNNNNTKKLDSLNRTKTSSVPKYCNDHLSRKQVIQSHIYR